MKIEEEWEYDYVKGRGQEPLINEEPFQMSNSLRREIQRKTFGVGRSANEKFYRWVWKRKEHFCEECGKPLRAYSSAYVSHILSRGAYPEMAHDPRNINMLCVEHHHQWEFGDRKSMRIYNKNIKLIEHLKTDYNGE